MRVRSHEMNLLESTEDRVHRSRQYLLSYIPALPFSFLPVVAGMNHHAPSFPPDPYILVRALLFAGCGTAAAWLVLRRVGCSHVAAICGFALWCCALTFYPPFRQLFIAATGANASRILALSYLTGCVLVIVVMLRSRPTTVRALYDAVRAMGVLLGVVMLAQVWGWYVGASSGSGESPLSNELRWIGDRDAPTARPDVYHVILDGFGRPDVLQAMYGLDLSRTVHGLKERGFDVAEENGSANYTQTYLSLASMLNIRYLDPTAELSPDAHSRVPLHRLIQRSSVIDAFKRLDYEIHFIGSIYSATQQHQSADICDCDYPLVGEFESTVIHGTPFGDIGFWGLDYRPHRSKLRRSLEALETLPPPTRSRFLIAHIMAPHPPFVYGAQGQEINPPRAFSLFDGSMYRGSLGEYGSGYSAQTEYIAARLLAAVDRFEEISRERGRQMVVIVHGDHGPRARFSAVDATSTDASEALPVLLAIRWSGSESSQERPVTSLVNIYRAFFRRYFNVNLELLPDRAFVSSFLTPYHFVEVDPSKLSSSPW